MSSSEVVQVPSASHTGTGRSPQVREEEYTRFERARILGARALQIALGAPILTDTPPTLIDPVEIAEREFIAGVIPITVRRGPRSS
ncbi:MAG TPA: DNA-directed RNA polymerase subunit K [Thermoplasmata archaeon]|nr:DNA-directed RNA polymerase subunit K [Thermoplasmata archaeon]